MIARRKLVLIGNGMAAGRFVDEVIARAGEAFELTVIGDEPHGSYNRIMLSAVLAGEMSAPQIIQKNADWYARAGITFKAGQRATRIDTQAQTVTLQNGEVIDYDELVLSTGSSPARIPAKGQHLNNILSFRTLEDVDAMSAAAANGQPAVVVGGGLLGLEAAYGLACKGVPVTLVHRSQHLLSRQLDARAGQYLKKVMESKNITFALGAEVASFNGESRVASATLNNGTTLPCGLAVIATGISANAQLGRDSGLSTGRGILVDHHLQTSAPHVSALGECCEFMDTTFGLVEPIWDQCITLAERLAGHSITPFALRPIATKLKVSGVQLYSAGEYTTGPQHRELVMDDPAQGVYRKLLIENDRIAGVVLFGDTRDGNFYFELMQNQTDVSSQLPMLLFGRNYCTFDETEHGGSADQAA